MPPRSRPQINFQVPEAMKLMYEEVKAYGNWVTRFCAAGFLLMVEEPELRRRAIARLRQWEAEFEDADPARIKAFVARCERAMTQPAEPQPAPRPRATRKARRAT